MKNQDGLFDLDAIRALSIKSTALSIGLVESPTKNEKGQRPRRDRWQICGECSSGSIAFDDRQNVFYRHKPGAYDHQGGDIIELARIYLAENGMSSSFVDAAKYIAAELDLWLDWKDTKARAKSLSVPKKNLKPMDWSGKLLTDLRGGRLGEQWAESKKLFDALEIDPRRVTLNMQALAGSASLCWQPAVPYQGMQISQKEREDGTKTFAGGWTRERAEAYWDSSESGLVFPLDIDGIPDGKGPRLALIFKVVNALGRQGFKPAAMVVSSWCDEASERAKVHVYYKASARAVSIEQFEKWHEMLGKMWDEAVRGLDADHEEKEELALDHATRQITRLLRIPGFAKYGKGHAAIVVASNPGVTVDFSTMEQTLPVRFMLGNSTYEFGEMVRVTTESDDPDAAPKTVSVGKNVWPLALVTDSDNPEENEGVLIRYHKYSGKVCYATVPASAWASSSSARRESEPLMGGGLRALPKKGENLVLALGAWANAAIPHRFTTVVRQNGWRDNNTVYVNGDKIYGADYVWDGGDDHHRTRQGSLEEWKRLIGENVEGWAIVVAMAVSLAGPFISLYKMKSFLIHLWQDTSRGKSVAAEVCQTIYGPKEKCLKWSATINAQETNLKAYSGAACVIDELGESADKPESVGSFLYRFSDNLGRERMSRSANKNRQRQTWALTGISTGELSLQNWIDQNGRYYKAGMAVRGIDFEVEDGDLTTSKENAVKLEAIRDSIWGVAGDAWIQAVHGMSAEERVTFRARAQEIAGMDYDAPENNHSNALGRIADQIALACAAMEEATRRGIMPDFSHLFTNDGTATSLEDYTALLFERTMERIAKGSLSNMTPNEKIWDAMKNIYATDPSRFPSEDHYSEGNSRNVVGIRKSGTVYTNSRLISAFVKSMNLPTTATRWVKEWAIPNGKMSQSRRERFTGGRQIRVMEVLLDEDSMTQEEIGNVTSRWL